MWLFQSIELKSANSTSMDMQLGVQIVKLPQFGKITNIYGQNITKEGTIVPITYGTATGYIRYMTNERSYFNFPTHNLLGDDLKLSPETVEYRIVAHNRGGRILDASPTVTMPIRVRHVNHAPVLIVPEQALTMQMKNTLSLVLVQGIRVDDVQDYDIDYVRVDVSTMIGKISLQADYQNLTNFDFCNQRSYSAWQCVGSGSGDRLMTFLALPSQIELILRNLEYRGFMPGRADEIQVRIYDGLGGDCLSQIEHTKLTNNTGSLHRGCTEVTATIVVPAFNYVDKNEKKEKNILGIPNTDFSNFGIADAVFWVVFFMFFCGCIGCAQTCNHCLARGPRIEADNNNGGCSVSEVSSTPDLSAITEGDESHASDEAV
jgi:hypothetical protein